MRKNFADILKDIKFDIVKEYEKLWDLFFDEEIYEIINENFDKLWFSGTVLTLDEFNNASGFNFHEKTEIDSNEIDYFISFCEYVYNIIVATKSYYLFSMNFDSDFFVNHILMLIEKIGYMQTEQDGFIIFVEKSPAVISVTEIVPKELSIKTLSYNHHSMRGDLSAKKNSLKQYADYLEPKREELRAANKILENDIFYAFNNFDIRHNNVESGNNKHYKRVIAEMDNSDLEKLYDETYQMCLLAILQLDNITRKKYFDDMKNKIEDTTNTH